MTTYSNVASGGATCGGTAFVSDPVVIFLATQRIDLTKYKISFRSQRVPPVTFQVYQEGRLISTIVSNSGTASVSLTIGIGETPFVEVLDNNSLPHPAFPGDLTLHWREISGAASYQVQQYNGTSWMTLTMFQDDPTQENYTYQTAWLADVTTYQFQVVPLDSTGAAGTPIGFTVEQVRHPDIPAVSYAYNGSTAKTVTISA